MKKVAIIGAGLTGLTIAQELKKHFTITVFEKSRGVGGRIATRHSAGFEFDHGAQYFTVKSALFKKFINPMLHSRVISRWDARFAEIKANKVLNENIWGASFPHYVGMPNMNRICQYLATDLDIRLNTKINVIKPDNLWRLFDENDNDLGEYDWVIVTAPAKQISQIMPASFMFKQNIMSVKMHSCYSLMLGFDLQPKLHYDAAFVKEADISWISVNSSKPGRPDKPTLVVNSTNAWADAHIDADQRMIIEHLCQELRRVTGIESHQAKCLILKRWRYANIGIQTDQNTFVNFEQQLAACGDWCIQGRVESAFLVGKRVANQILAKMT